MDTSLTLTDNEDFVNAGPVIPNLLFFGFGVCFSMSEFLDTIDISAVTLVNNGADMSSEFFDSSPFSPCLFSSSVGEFSMTCSVMSFLVPVFPERSALHGT